MQQDHDPRAGAHASPALASGEEDGSRRLGRRLPVLLSAGVLALGAMGLAACGDEESPATETGGGGAGQVQEDTAGADAGGEATGEVPAGAEVTVDDLLSNATDYYGEQVTVSGEVGRTIVQPGAFTLGAEVGGGGEGDVGDTASGAQSVLVLPTSGAQVPQQEITESDAVQVQGTVQQVTPDITQEGDFLFENAGDEAFLEDYTDQVGIVASQIDATAPQEGSSG